MSQYFLLGKVQLQSVATQRRRLGASRLAGGKFVSVERTTESVKLQVIHVAVGRHLMAPEYLREIGGLKENRIGPKSL